MEITHQKYHLPYIHCRYNLQQLEIIKKMIDKQSDYLKKIKGANAIRVAHKNRKQKIMLNSYFMGSSSNKTNKLSSLQQNDKLTVL
jgi:hypothetical protein